MSLTANAPQFTDFAKQSQRLVNWCKRDALPLWASKGLDEAGGFFETLNYDGTPHRTVKRRVRVQARQTYVFSLAVTKGWYNSAFVVADHGWKFLTTKGLSGGQHLSDEEFNGCAHLLNADGSLHDGKRDTYAQAFLLLSSAWRYRATGDRHARAVLYATTKFLTDNFTSENGGWVEDCQNSLPRRQNPHMHLFEAFLAAYEATGDCQFMLLATDIFELFKTHFYDVKNNFLLEYFEQDWSPLNRKSARIEPGHMMEWCWLLEWYGRLTGRHVKQYVDALFVSSIKHGLNPKTGLLINECRSDGRVSNGSSRLWPQTEFIKACIARYRLGDENALSLAATVIDRLFSAYLETPLRGGWHDSIDPEGKVESSQMPASTFYHLACATSEVAAISNWIKNKAA